MATVAKVSTIGRRLENNGSLGRRSATGGSFPGFRRQRPSPKSGSWYSQQRRRTHRYPWHRRRQAFFVHRISADQVGSSAERSGPAQRKSKRQAEALLCRAASPGVYGLFPPFRLGDRHNTHPAAGLQPATYLSQPQKGADLCANANNPDYLNEYFRFLQIVHRPMNEQPQHFLQGKLTEKATAPVPRPDRRFYAQTQAFGRFGIRWFDPQIIPEEHVHASYRAEPG